MIFQFKGIMDEIDEKIPSLFIDTENDYPYIGEGVGDST